MSDLGGRRDYSDWLERAAAQLDLRSMFTFVDGIDVDVDWQAISDPDGMGETKAVARIAISRAAGVAVGTVESSTNRRRRSLIEHLAFAGDLDDLEGAAVKLSFESGVPLPVELELAWSPRFWKTEGPLVLRRVVSTAEEHGSCAAIHSTLNDSSSMRCLVWMAESEPARFEGFLLELEGRCEAGHLRSLRRAVRHEVRNHRAQLRLRRARELSSAPELGLVQAPEAVIGQVLDALAHFIAVNHERLWRGHSAHHRARVRREPSHWVGRWDGPDSAVSIDAELVRTILGRYGNPRELLTILGQRGLLTPGPNGLRWQRRVGRRRRNCYTLVPPARGWVGDESIEHER